MTRPKPIDSPLRRFYSETDVSHIFNVSESIVGGWIRDELIRVVRLGPRTYRIPAEEIERIARDGIPVKHKRKAAPASLTPVADSP
jgi:hypothetical protein